MALTAKQIEEFNKAGELSDKDIARFNTMGSSKGNAITDYIAKSLGGNPLEPVAKAAPAVRKAQKFAGSGLQAIADFATSPLNLAGIDRLVGNKNKPFRIPIEENPDEFGYMAGGILNPVDPLAKLKIASRLAGPGAGLLRKIASKGAEGAVRGGVTTAGIGATTRTEDQERDILGDLGQGAAIGGAFGAGPGLISKAIPEAVKAPVRGAANALINRLKQSYERAPNLYRSPERVKEMEGILPQDLKFNIGEIVNSPGLKKFYTSYAGKVPWTGVKGEEQKALNYAVGKTNDVQKTLLGNTHESDVLKTLQKDVSKLHGERVTTANKAYSAIRNEANKRGFTITDAAQTANKASQYLKEDKEAYSKFLTPEARGILEKWAGIRKKGGNPSTPEGYKGPSISFVKKIQEKQDKKIPLEPWEKETLQDFAKAGGDGMRIPKTFDEMRKERKYFSDQAREAEKKLDYNTARIMRDMKDSLGKDIEKEFKKKGLMDLHKAFRNTEKYYAKDVAPFRHDPQIMKIVRGDMKSGSVPNALLDEKNRKVFDVLPQASKNLIGYHLMRTAMKNTDEGVKASPMMMKNRLEALSPEVEKRLFPAATRKLFNEQKTLARATEEGAKAAQIHQTGKQAAELGTLWKVLTHPGSFATAGIAGRQIGKLLTSPTVRRSYADKKKIERGSREEKELLKDFYGKRTTEKASSLIDFLKRNGADKKLESLTKHLATASYYGAGNKREEKDK